MKGHEEPTYRFGPFLLVAGERLLLRDGAPIALAGRPFDLLVALVRQHGHLLTKDELLRRVWPGMVVEEVNLSVNVSAIRKALGCAPGTARWIEAVPRQGYRFTAPVDVADVATLAPARPRAVEPTRDTAAYQSYQQGRYLWNQRSESGLRRAITHFQRAIELDPAFALAHAALADAYVTLGTLSHDAPVETFPVARLFALKAIELDPSLSQAHAALAYVRFYFDWDWPGADEAFRRALELAPDDPVAHQWRATSLLAAGRADEGMAEIHAARRLDPLSLAINTDIGFHHYYNGRHAEAIAQLQSVLGMKSDFGPAHLWLARSFLAAGRLDSALVEISSAESAIPGWPVLVAQRGHTLGVMGRSDEARAAQAEMARLSGKQFVTAYGMALVFAGLGDGEQAFAWLDRAFAERSHWLVWLRLDPRWESLRTDPRFERLVDRVKYPA